MKEEILFAISKHTRWSTDELDSAYNCLESYDLVIAAINVADRFNLELTQACGIIDR